MARVNFRKALDRLGHVESYFVRAECYFPEAQALIEFRAMSERDANLFVRNHPNKKVPSTTIHATGVIAANLRTTFSIETIYISSEHDLLWAYDSAAEIICNQPLDIEAWIAIRDLVVAPFGLFAASNGGLLVANEQVMRHGRSGSFSLGRFPRPIFEALTVELERHGIQYFAPHTPTATELPLLLDSDAGTIIAKDFEVEYSDG